MCLQPFAPLENDVKCMKTIVLNYSMSHLLQHCVFRVSCVLDVLDEGMLYVTFNELNM